MPQKTCFNSSFPGCLFVSSGFARETEKAAWEWGALFCIMKSTANPHKPVTVFTFHLIVQPDTVDEYTSQVFLTVVLVQSERLKCSNYGK